MCSVKRLPQYMILRNAEQLTKTLLSLTEITGTVEGSYERLGSDSVTKISCLPSTIHRAPERNSQI